MKKLGWHEWLGVSLVAAACGCSSSSSTPAGNTDAGSDSGGSLPGITISSPTAAMAVMLTPPTDTVPVTFATTNFTMKAPGMCAGAANCGHIHVLIDGAACTPAGAPYNNDGVASPVNAKAGSCPMANGAHTITLEIHNDDHSPVKDASGTVIQASVAITTSGG